MIRIWRNIEKFIYRKAKEINYDETEKVKKGDKIAIVSLSRGGVHDYTIKKQEFIKYEDYVVDEIGMSKSQVVCFSNKVLKIEMESEESNNEHTMLQ